MIIPPYLKPGDRVSIVSPAKVILPNEISFAIQELESFGLTVELGKHVFSTWNRFAGKDTERTLDVQFALDDPEIKAVFFARGGYGSVRIIDKIDFSQFSTSPKWLVGYSDITVFHQHVNATLNIATCHATMPLNMVNKELNRKSTTNTIDMLFGKKLIINSDFHNYNKLGKVTGEIVGGNLSVLCSLIGTNSFMNPKGKILFIEDLCEEIYHLDRMMYQLKKSGFLQNLKGLIVGGFTDMTDVSTWFDKSAYEIIHDHVKEYDYPQTFDFPSGHISFNQPIPFGKEVLFDVSNQGTTLK